jgi:hypothetical protein
LGITASFVHPTDICVKNQSKTPHRLRARGDNKMKKKKKKKKNKKYPE